jgi:thiol-disulfide isomerase/thioredoxin
MWWWLACSGAAQPEPKEPLDGLVSEQRLKAALSEPTDGGRVVNFWATWCGPCVEEMPRLQAWSRAHPDVDLLFVSLDLPKARERLVVPFLSQHGLADAHHVQLDVRDAAGAMPGIVDGWTGDIPMTLILSADGREVGRRVGRIADPDRELTP